jgi:hypothetical protein
MALISCPDCSNDVADSAPTCPVCGRPWPGGQSKLEVRRAQRLSAGRVVMDVLIDGSYAGGLTAGKSLTVDVSPGRHRVECRMNAGPSKGAAEEFTVPPGGHLVVVVVPNALTGKPSFTAALD